MARLPTAEELGVLPSALSNRPIATYDVSGYARGAAAMAEGLGNLGKGIGKAADTFGELRQREERNRLDRAKADANTQIVTKGLRTALARESDPDAVIKAYPDAFRNAYASSSELIDDPQAREAWTLARSADRDGDIAGSLDHAEALRRGQNVEAVTTQLEALKTTALDDEDEAARTKAIDTGNNLIFGLHGTGAIDEAQAKAMREHWATSYAEGRIGRLPPDERIATLESGAGIAEFVPLERRAELIRAAQADKLDLDRKAQSDAGVARFVTDRDIADDLKQIAATGRGLEGLTPQRIDDTLGSEARRAWQAKHDEVFAVWRATHDFSTLPSDKIEQRVAAFEPKEAGDSGDAAGIEALPSRERAIYDQVSARAEAVHLLRAGDPAASVADDPNVKAARAALDPNDIRSFHKLINARLAAQAAAGIPQALRSPITQDEARQLLAPWANAAPEQRDQAMVAVAERFTALFGADANRVLDVALRVQAGDDRAAQASGEFDRLYRAGADGKGGAPRSDLIDVGARERFRLHMWHSFYTETVAGATFYAYYKWRAGLPITDGMPWRQRAALLADHKTFANIQADLAAYERMKPAETWAERLAVAGGVAAGNAMTPESFIGWQVKGATMLGRIGKAALQQGAISGGTDVGLQVLDNISGRQDGFDGQRVGTQALIGAVFGGAIRAGVEGVGAAKTWVRGADEAPDTGVPPRATDQAADQFGAPSRAAEDVAPESGVAAREGEKVAEGAPATFAEEVLGGADRAAAAQVVDTNTSSELTPVSRAADEPVSRRAEGSSEASAIDDSGGIIESKPVEAAKRKLTGALRIIGDEKLLSEAAPFDASRIVEGEVKSLESLPGYIRDVATTATAEPSVPRFSFALGPAWPELSRSLAKISPEIAEAADKAVTISNEVVNKLYMKNPIEATRLLQNLPEIFERGESFFNPRGWGRDRALLIGDFWTGRGNQKHQAVVFEVALSQDAAQIVTIHVIPPRTLKKIKSEANAAR